MNKEPILVVKDLKQHFKVNRKFTVKAVDGISFEIYPGETYGLVGESGSGKSTTGRSIIRLYEPTAGNIVFNGEDISGKMSKKALKNLRTNMQMIFQDPMACLNPRKKVLDIIGEGLDIHKSYSSLEERNEKIYEMLELVGLSREHASRYPHQFSGGQRQRIGIARAIALQPKLIICDEPVSALDVSIQAKIINLLKQLQKDLGIAYIFISHDLSVVKHIADRVVVMYLGNVMEMADKKDLFKNPSHPYTQALLDAVPKISEERIDDKDVLSGDVPSPANPPKGCCFCTRCPKAMEICHSIKPELIEIEPGHQCACHLFTNQK